MTLVMAGRAPQLWAAASAWVPITDLSWPALKARGAPRVVLHTATSNTTAQALFRAKGFRTTMLVALDTRFTRNRSTSSAWGRGAACRYIVVSATRVTEHEQPSS